MLTVDFNSNSVATYENVKNPAPKAWYKVAIAVGILVVLGGAGFGAVGLFQSHQLITLPQSMQWLANAIGTVGNPGLWAIGAGGLAAGGGLIALGAIQLVRRARQEMREARAFEEKQELARLGFGDHFNEIGYSKEDEDFSRIRERQCCYFYAPATSDLPSGCFVILRTQSGELLVTLGLGYDNLEALMNTLTERGYYVEHAKLEELGFTTEAPAIEPVLDTSKIREFTRIGNDNEQSIALVAHNRIPYYSKTLTQEQVKAVEKSLTDLGFCPVSE